MRQTNRANIHVRHGPHDRVPGKRYEREQHVGSPADAGLDKRRDNAFTVAMHGNKDATLARLKRLEGQVRGIARMVEEDRYCVDILTQTAAIRAALKGVETLIIDDHASHCIEDAVASGDPDQQREKFLELIRLLDKARA